MSTGFLVVILALIWVAVNGNFSGLNLLFGGLIGAGVVMLLRRALVGHKTLLRAKRIVSLIWLFLYELVISAAKVAWVVVQPDMRSIKPAMVAVPLTVKSDWEITILANMITLTPGTLSIDVAPDRSVLYVHALTVEDHEHVIGGIVDGFEKKVMEVFQ